MVPDAEGAGVELVVTAHELRRLAVQNGDQRLQRAVGRYLLELVSCDRTGICCSPETEGHARSGRSVWAAACMLRHRASCADLQGTKELAEALVELSARWCGADTQRPTSGPVQSLVNPPELDKRA